jgi:hypothetical protein
MFHPSLTGVIVVLDPLKEKVHFESMNSPAQEGVVINLVRILVKEIKGGPFTHPENTESPGRQGRIGSDPVFVHRLAPLAPRFVSDPTSR